MRDKCIKVTCGDATRKGELRLRAACPASPRRVQQFTDSLEEELPGCPRPIQAADENHEERLGRFRPIDMGGYSSREFFKAISEGRQGR